MDDAAIAIPDYAALAGHLSPVLGRYFEHSWSHGEGHRLFDTSGKAYLDFANGIAVTVLGHRHPRVTEAIHRQVDRLIGPTGAIGYAEPVVQLASMVAGTLPDPIDTVFFLNSGSEAGGRRGGAQARPPSNRASGDHRVRGRLPRPNAGSGVDYDLIAQLPDRL